MVARSCGTPSGSWSVDTPLAIAPPLAFAASVERRISSAVASHGMPMPRWAVSIASATPSPSDHRCSRNASVVSQSTATSRVGSPGARTSATTWAAA